MGKIRRAIGLMSGTSLDGIDVALLETDGDVIVRRVAGAVYSYEPEFRTLLVRAIEAAQGVVDRTARPGVLAEAECEVTARHGEAVEWFLGTQGLAAGEIEVIGFHGQTVLHRPDDGLTVQLGDGPALAQRLGIDVVYDLRAADCAAGGQGAPLVPVYHRALAARLPQRPVAFLNIGGVANVTFVGHGSLIAFDTGPGNALIDDWMMRQTGKPVDKDGGLAAKGQVDEAILAKLLMHDYFAELPPKSLDRNTFTIDGGRAPGPVQAVYEGEEATVMPAIPGLLDGLSNEDGAATLTAFTAAAIARAEKLLPEPPALWIVCGGGRRNRTLMSAIAGRVENAVVPAEAVHLDGNAMEAEAFAYLAVRSLDGLPLTYLMTTGAETTGGVLAKGR